MHPEGTLRQGLHEPFEGLVEPPIEGGPCHPGYFKLQIGPQDICLVGPAWRPSRDDHGPDEHPEVQFALPLDDTERLTQAVNLILGQHLLEHLAYFISGHIRSLLCLPLSLAISMHPSRGVEHAPILPSRGSGIAITAAVGLK
jgi:hypothetical protein